jgi:hypothetical protein
MDMKMNMTEKEQKASEALWAAHSALWTAIIANAHNDKVHSMLVDLDDQFDEILREVKEI